MTDIKERLRIVSQSPRSFDTALLKDALGEIEHLQSKIDALMLEYCPDEMTPEQVTEWAAHQRPASQKEPT